MENAFASCMVGNKAHLGKEIESKLTSLKRRKAEKVRLYNTVLLTINRDNGWMYLKRLKRKKPQQTVRERKQQQRPQLKVETVQLGTVL